MLRQSNTIPIPTVDDVAEALEVMFNDTDLRRREYEQCIDDAFVACSVTLEVQSETESERSRVARQANVATRDGAQETAAACANSHAVALASMRAWQQEVATSLPSPELQYKSSCTYADRQRLQSMTGDSTAQQCVHAQIA
jgi:hypothetical protein